MLCNKTVYIKYMPLDFLKRSETVGWKTAFPRSISHIYISSQSTQSQPHLNRKSKPQSFPNQRSYSLPSNFSFDNRNVIDRSPFFPFNYSIKSESSSSQSHSILRQPKTARPKAYHEHKNTFAVLCSLTNSIHPLLIKFDLFFLLFRNCTLTHQSARIFGIQIAKQSKARERAS